LVKSKEGYTSNSIVPQSICITGYICVSLFDISALSRKSSIYQDHLSIDLRFSVPVFGAESFPTLFPFLLIFQTLPLFCAKNSSWLSSSNGPLF